MQITRTSIWSGKTRTLDLDFTLEEYNSWLNKEKLIQDAFPRLNADEREFILSGAWDNEFDEAMKEDDEPTDQQEPAF